MVKLNHKRRKKMRRKIQRRDIGWEQVLIELTIYEMKSHKKKGDIK
jgi:hypothetical protein